MATRFQAPIIFSRKAKSKPGGSQHKLVSPPILPINPLAPAILAHEPLANSCNTVAFPDGNLSFYLLETIQVAKQNLKCLVISLSTVTVACVQRAERARAFGRKKPCEEIRRR